MGPGAGLSRLRGDPCRRWWWGWGWEVGPGGRSANWFEEAAAAIAAATARGFGKSPAPRVFGSSFEKVKEDYKWMWHNCNCWCMQAFSFKVNDVFMGKNWEIMECLDCDKLSIYHKLCALLVPTEKRIGFSCNSITMPPARYMLQHKIAKHRYWILRLLV